MQLPTPAWPFWSSWPGSSWLKLVLHVSCRHLGRFPDKGSFHQVSCQDSPGEVCKAVSAGAHQPCREEAAPTVPPAPLTKCPLPWASTISPGSVTFSVSIPSHSSLSTSSTPFHWRAFHPGHLPCPLPRQAPLMREPALHLQHPPLPYCQQAPH